MFLSWKRYTKKMSKAREAEKAIAPFLEVLAKESWERDEKDDGRARTYAPDQNQNRRRTEDAHEIRT